MLLSQCEQLICYLELRGPTISQGEHNARLAGWILGVVHVLSLEFGKSNRAPLIFWCPLLFPLPFFILPSMPFIVSCLGYSTLFHSSFMCCAIWPYFGVAKKHMFLSFQTKQATICSKNALLPLRRKRINKYFCWSPDLCYEFNYIWIYGKDERVFACY